MTCPSCGRPVQLLGEFADRIQLRLDAASKPFPCAWPTCDNGPKTRVFCFIIAPPPALATPRWIAEHSRIFARRKASDGYRWDLAQPSDLADS